MPYTSGKCCDIGVMTVGHGLCMAKQPLVHLLMAKGALQALLIGSGGLAEAESVLTGAVSGLPCQEFHLAAVEPQAAALRAPVQLDVGILDHDQS